MHSGTGGANGCDDVDTIFDADAKNICAVISRHRRTGEYTVAVFKQYERDGDLMKTAFVPRLLVPAAQRVLEAASGRCEILEAEDKARREARQADTGRRGGGRR